MAKPAEEIKHLDLRYDLIGLLCFVDSLLNHALRLKALNQYQLTELEMAQILHRITAIQGKLERVLK